MIFEALDELVEVEFFFLTEDVVDAFDMRYLARLELGIAARDDKDGVGVISPDTMDHLAVLMVRSIGDRTGIDDAEVRLLPTLRSRMTTGNKRFGEGTALRKIEFTS